MPNTDLVLDYNYKLYLCDRVRFKIYFVSQSKMGAKYEENGNFIVVIFYVFKRSIFN